MARGFVYLVAIMDWYSRKESWTLLIGRSLDDDKCFLQDERYALERSNETEKTKPFA